MQQIVEYPWPPAAILPPGEKPENYMIQEQISEYLGVKSFKRKYPNIKRRPVDMEERNYLQENGYVTENMCDMGEISRCESGNTQNDHPSARLLFLSLSKQKKSNVTFDYCEVYLQEFVDNFEKIWYLFSPDLGFSL